MKKLSIFLAILCLFASCNTTTSTSQDKEMLQKKYDVVYLIHAYRYICIDSLNTVYDISITNDGQILSTVEIK